MHMTAGRGGRASVRRAGRHERHEAQLRLESTAPRVFIDITDQLQVIVARSGVEAGTLTAQTLHTTTGVVVNEHEPLLLDDMLAMLNRLAPCEAAYGHDDPVRRTVNLTPAERRNGHAHCQALFLPTSATLVVRGGRLALGRWQRVFLVELDGPQVRDVAVVVG